MSRADARSSRGRRGKVATDHQQRVLAAVRAFYEAQDGRTPAQGRTGPRSASRRGLAQRNEPQSKRPNPLCGLEGTQYN